MKIVENLNGSNMKQDDSDDDNINEISTKLISLKLSLGGNDKEVKRESGSCTDRGPDRVNKHVHANSHYRPYQLPCNIDGTELANSQLLLSGGGTVVAEQPPNDEHDHLQFQDDFLDLLDLDFDSIIPDDLVDFVLQNDNHEFSPNINAIEKSLSDESVNVGFDATSPGNDSGLESSSYSQSSSSPRFSELWESDSGCESASIKEKTKKLNPILPKKSTATMPALTTETKTAKKNKRNNSANFTAAERSKFLKKIISLSDNPDGLAKRDTEGKTYLHASVIIKNEKFAMYLVHILEIWLEKYPNQDKLKGISSVQSMMDMQDNHGRTALFYSTFLNLPLLTEYFIQKQANPNLAESETGDTPLHFACQRGQPYLETVRALAKSKTIDLDRKNKIGQTALHQAVKTHLSLHADYNCEETQLKVISSKSIIEQLLRSGAKLAIQDNEGRTPLHLAVGTGMAELVDLQHDFSSDFTVAVGLKDRKGLTAMEYAQKTKLPNEELRQMLIKNLVIYASMPSLT